MGRFLHSVLRLRGHNAVSVPARAALDFMVSSRPDVSLVITNAPGIFLQFADSLALIYIAACPDHAMASRFRKCRVLQKPFHPAQLLEAVDVLTDVR